VDSRERVLVALKGGQVDRVPLALWRYHYHRAQTAEGLARATVDFYRGLSPDLLILTPTPFYLAQAWDVDVRSFSQDDVPPHLAGAYVARATDWRRLPAPDLKTSSLQRELRACRLVREELGSEVPVLLLLESPLTTADVLCNGRILDDLRTFGNDVRAGLNVIAALTRAFALASLEAGVDGFFYSNRWSGRETLRAREQRDFGQGYDLELLRAVAANPTPRGEPLNVLYLEGDQPKLDLAERYPVQAVCWETWRATPSLAAARRSLRCGLMGGVNPSTFVSGRQADVQAQVRAALEQTGGWRLILSPTGPLPPRARPELLAALRAAIDEV
jgi:uroporphyrinogen decarboxylase